MYMFRASLQALVLAGAWFMAAAAHGQTTASFSPNQAVAGQSVSFTWRGFTGSTRCSILGVPGLEGIQANGGTFAFSASQSLSANVLCSRPGGGFVPGASAAARFTLIGAPPAPVVSASFSPALIELGQATTLTFNSSFASSCSSSQVPISGTSGSLSLAPSVPTTVTITCSGPAGSTSASATVNVVPFLPPTIQQFPLDSEAGINDPVGLLFTTTRATTCNIRGTIELNDIGVQGSLTLGFGPGLYVSTLICSGPGGSTTDTIFFTVFPRNLSIAGSSSVDSGSEARPLSAGFSVERDVDGDGRPESIEYTATRATLTIVFKGRDGSLEAKVLDKVTDLGSVAIKVERTPQGREVSLRSRQ